MTVVLSKGIENGTIDDGKSDLYKGSEGITTDEDVGLREGGIICKRMVGIRWNGSEWRGIGSVPCA